MRLHYRRYHHKVYFPDNLPELLREFVTAVKFVDVTSHAADELIDDKLTVIPLPSKEEIFHSDNTLVEFYQRVGKFDSLRYKIQKAVLRVHNLDSRFDYSYVLAREGYIVSAWANHKKDNHRLVKQFDRYYCPQDIKAGVYQKLLNEEEEHMKNWRPYHRHPQRPDNGLM